MKRFAFFHMVMLVIACLAIGQTLANLNIHGI